MSTTVTLVYDDTPSFTNQPLQNIYRSYAIVETDGVVEERIAIGKGELLARRGAMLSPECIMPDGRLGRKYYILKARI